MNFSQLLLILRTRFRIIMLVLVVTVIATFTVSLLLPKTYQATTTLVLNYKGVDPVTGLTLPSQLMPGYMGTLRESLADESLTHLEVKPSHESSVLNISFNDSNAQLAANVANAFASAYQHTSVQLKVNPSKEAAVYFSKQIKLLRDNFETAQRKVSKYQQDNDIVNADNRYDVESNRLNELSTQLVMVQGHTVCAQFGEANTEVVGSVLTGF